MDLNFHGVVVQVAHHMTADLSNQETDLSADHILLLNLEVFFHYAHF